MVTENKKNSYLKKGKVFKNGKNLFKKVFKE